MLKYSYFEKSVPHVDVSQSPSLFFDSRYLLTNKPKKKL